MKTRILIIVGITLLILGMILLNFVLIQPPFGSEHCPGLELRKSLGLVDPTSACL
ncbi:MULTISPECIES: hypothetical protein [Nitrosopumilus]|uniref:hypothetical protein n=1 Tax=Nitrosopumilus TaxID=338191 RepID=UPI000B24BDD8|nr:MULTISPECIES: hypothetical protein [Nitrosopumilus]